MHRWLILAQQPRRKTISCKGHLCTHHHHGGALVVLVTIITVESTEGISEIWVRATFPAWGFLGLGVRVSFADG